MHHCQSNFYDLILVHYLQHCLHNNLTKVACHNNQLLTGKRTDQNYFIFLVKKMRLFVFFFFFNLFRKRHKYYL